jgi:hypothetical protein
MRTTIRAGPFAIHARTAKSAATEKAAENR